MHNSSMSKRHGKEAQKHNCAFITQVLACLHIQKKHVKVAHHITRRTNVPEKRS